MQADAGLANMKLLDVLKHIFKNDGIGAFFGGFSAISSGYFLQVINKLLVK